MIADVRQTRRINIKAISGRYASLAEFARRCGMNPAQLNQIFKIQDSGEPLRYVGDKLARRIESSVGLEPRWLDVPHDNQVLAAVQLAAASAHLPGAMDGEVPGPRGGTFVAPGAFVNVSGLSHLQLATVEALARLAQAGGLPERECLHLLSTWTAQREELVAEAASGDE